MRRQPATANELYAIASRLGSIDADLVKSAADELTELRDEVNRLRSIVLAEGGRSAASFRVTQSDT